MGAFWLLPSPKTGRPAPARFFKQPTEHSSFSHRLELESRPIVLRPQFPVQQSSWYGPRSVFRQRTGSPPIRDSGETMRNNVAWERRRCACRSKEASGWSPTRSLNGCWTAEDQSDILRDGTGEEDSAIRRATYGGRPLGSEEFVTCLEVYLRRRLKR